MAFKRAAQSPQIKAGQWVLPTTNSEALCGLPRLVSRDYTSGRLWFRRPKAEDPQKEHFMNLSSVAFVCDTEEEAEQLRAFSEERSSALAAAASKVRAEYSARLNVLLGIAPADTATP